MVLTEKDQALLKRKFAGLVVSCAGETERNEEEKKNEKSVSWRYFSLRSKTGKVLYQSFRDEELLFILRKTAEKLDHSPSQKEVLWVFREYIKKRFQKWPYALELAGLSKGAGKGGKTLSQAQTEEQERKEILEELKNMAEVNGYLPHPHQCPKLTEKIKKYYDSWGKALLDAGIPSVRYSEKTVYSIPDLNQEEWVLLHKLSGISRRLGRAPMHHEIDEDIKRRLLERCGSWRNVLYQIGLEPVVRMKPFDKCYLDYRQNQNKSRHSRNLRNCYYRILNMDEPARADLEALKKKAAKDGKMPEKNQVPEPVRKRLQDACGSWGNVLYQLRI